jgi:hypothetical protein
MGNSGLENREYSISTESEIEDFEVKKFGLMMVQRV